MGKGISNNQSLRDSLNNFQQENNIDNQPQNTQDDEEFHEKQRSLAEIRQNEMAKAYGGKPPKKKSPKKKGKRNKA